MYSKKVNWAMHIRKQAQSAQTIVKYCSENNLNIHSFQYQRRKKSAKLVSNFVPAEIVSDMPIKDGLSISQSIIDTEIHTLELSNWLKNIKNNI